MAKLYEMLTVKRDSIAHKFHNFNRTNLFIVAGVIPVIILAKALVEHQPDLPSVEARGFGELRGQNVLVTGRRRRQHGRWHLNVQLRLCVAQSSLDMMELEIFANECTGEIVSQEEL